ncbi:hypothetical protein [Oceanicoccus sp. KOV_DT_Chl]|uniref:hypothetical protein n=1 Tax=Oceanicoccus sp. KOV_DT_Chl TaxID=1904639 RepID=UPI000C7AAD53|nr:hypothetical protein [Oceanicoccus sp. KOV_DT_Chl]
MKKLMFALSMGISTFANAADCLDPEWFKTQPAIVSGASATFNEMYQVQTEVKEYVKKGTASLDCLHTSYRYNIIVDQMQNAANKYNQELKAYRDQASSNSVAVN